LGQIKGTTIFSLTLTAFAEYIAKRHFMNTFCDKSRAWVAYQVYVKKWKTI